MPGAGVVLVDFLVRVGGIEPPRPLLLLLLGVGVEARVRAAAVLFEVKGCDSGRDLHLPFGPRALQQHREAVGIAGAVALSLRERVDTRYLGL